MPGMQGFCFIDLGAWISVTKSLPFVFETGKCATFHTILAKSINRKSFQSKARLIRMYPCHKKQMLQLFASRIPLAENAGEIAIGLVWGATTATAIKLPLRHDDATILWLYIVLNAAFGLGLFFVRAHEPEGKLHNECFTASIS